MLVKSIRLIVLLLLVFNIAGKTQTPEQKKKQKVDSLRQLLVVAKHDTDKLRLRHQIGKITIIKRVPFWDSLLLDARRSHHAWYEIKALIGLGFCYQHQHNFKKAAVYLEQARNITIEKGYRREQLAVLTYLIVSYQENPTDKVALDLNYEGLRLAEELNIPRYIAMYYSAIGNAHFFSEEYRRALVMHVKCLQKSREINDNLAIMRALISIGSDFHGLKDSLSAAYYYLESKKYVSAFADTKYASETYNSVAAAFSFLNFPDSAIWYSEKALEVSRRVNDPYGMTGAMASLADRYFEKGELRRAEKMARDALYIVDSVKFYPQVPSLALILKKIHLHEHNYKEALKDYELYVTAMDSLSNEKSRKHALTNEYAYNLEKKENDNKLLTQKNEIQSLRLNQNNYLLLALVVLLILVAVIAYLFIRQNKLKTRQQKIQLEQRLLHSQMNPHFIFNSLNSIQQFIMQNQNDKAELYLSKFAKLIRELLESNINDGISVKEEVGILNGYIEMESLRFGNSFNYRIVVDEKINEEQVSIPHMMIQPFIENAIWHGLLAKDSDRDLLVKFEYDTPKTVRCEVEDNGVGREASKKRESLFKKKSLALSFVKQRLELMRATFKVNCSVEVIDKKNNNGNSTGTKIVVFLPVIQQH